MPVNKENRLNITIREENLSEMQKIRENCKKRGLSFSDEICRLVTKYYYLDIQSKVSPTDEIPSPFPRLDQYFEKKINGRDANTEIPRLLQKGIVSPEQVSGAYIGAKQFTIQMERTEILSKAIELKQNDYTIESKRDGQYQFVLDRVKGNLVDLFEKEKKKMEIKKAKEKEKLEIEKWIKENPGIPYAFRDLSDEQREIQKMIASGELIIAEDEEINEEEEKLVNNILPS